MSNCMDKINFSYVFVCYESKKKKRYLIQFTRLLGRVALGRGWWFCQGNLKEGLITDCFPHTSLLLIYSLLNFCSCSSDTLMLIYSWSLRLWLSLPSSLENSFLHFTSLRGWPQASFWADNSRCLTLTLYTTVQDRLAFINDVMWMAGCYFMLLC